MMISTRLQGALQCELGDHTVNGGLAETGRDGEEACFTNPQGQPIPVPQQDPQMQQAGMAGMSKITG